MCEYRIMTDSGCDMQPETLKKWGITCIDLTFKRTTEQQSHANRSMAAKDFYKEMREGTVFQTSAVNPNDYETAFCESLRGGLDVLYLCMSSGLTTSVNSAHIAAKEAMQKYPGRQIVVLDTLCASAGEGLLLYYASQKKAAGLSLSETAEYVLEIAPHICHWFTVDDLLYLKRGGRVSPAAYFAATILQIKPVMHMDDAGKLTVVSKVHGRKQAIKALADKYLQSVSAQNRESYFISHGDCPEDAQLLESIIVRNTGISAACITDIGPVIGSHSGPGTLAVFFLDAKR